MEKTQTITRGTAPLTEKQLLLYLHIESYYAGEISTFGTMVLSINAYSEKLALKRHLKNLRDSLIAEKEVMNRDRVIDFITNQQALYDQRLITLNQFLFDIRNTKPNYAYHG